MYDDDGVSKSKCPCFSTTKNRGSFSLLLDLNVTVVNPDGSEGSPFVVLNFTSIPFTKIWAEDNIIPSGLSANVITQNDVFYEEMEEKVVTGCDAVSNAEGFSCLGWVRRGEQVDQATADKGANSGANSRIAQQSNLDSADLKFHLTEIKVNKPLIGEGLNLSPYQSNLNNVTADNHGGGVGAGAGVVNGDGGGDGAPPPQEEDNVVLEDGGPDDDDNNAVDDDQVQDD